MKKMMMSLVLLLCSANLIMAGGVKVGDKVSNIKLKNIDGKMYSLEEQKSAKGFIVIFTCNHCPFSVKYEDRIIALQNKYEKLGYPVVAINPNDVKRVPEDSFEEMIVRAREKQFNFPYLYDETQAVASRFGAARTPHVFILNKEKSGLMVKYIGAIDDNVESAKEVNSAYVENAMDEILAGKVVTQSATKAIGCTIKWKE